MNEVKVHADPSNWYASNKWRDLGAATQLTILPNSDQCYHQILYQVRQLQLKIFKKKYEKAEK